MTLAKQDNAAMRGERIAALISGVFDEYVGEFKAITLRARGHFEQRDWGALYHDAEARLELHGAYVYRAIDRLNGELGEHVAERESLRQAKTVYSGLIAQRGDFDRAQTFYNSVTMRLGSGGGLDPALHFVGGELQEPAGVGQDQTYHVYPRHGNTAKLIAHVLHDYPFACGYADLAASATLAAREIDEHVAENGWKLPIERLELARPVFYRGQLAFLVGRVCSHLRYVPLVLALANGTDGVAVDAVLLSEDEVSILFSFSRWYFLVDVDKPAALVRFLKSLLPLKPVAELYISLGYDKHGKTELYRSLLHHLENSSDSFEVAPGARGMVMLVFTLPSFDVVFKVIKDRFDYPKDSTRQYVLERYNLVFKHDRGGRLIDAQEFTHLRFPKDRFTPALLDELLRLASKTVAVDGDRVVFKHLYTERRLVPLNIYLVDAPAAAAANATVELGQAIKDMAATNIFPGDILLKNFGVTRHGRVIFYDYDELCLLTDCTFREIPQRDDPFDDMGDEPSYQVGPQDVFPEEMHYFLSLPPHLNALFNREHGDLFGVDFWNSLKHKYESGQIIDVIPYREARRLSESSGDAVFTVKEMSNEQ